MLQRISEPLSDKGESLGNKGKFLCLMSEAGFLVPDGVILDSSEYIRFLKENGITTAVEELLSEMNKDNVAEISEKITALFEGKHFGEELR